MQGKSSSSVAGALFVGLAVCMAVMYVTADGSDIMTETVLAKPAKSVYGIGGPTSVDSEDVQKAGTVITNTPDGRMRLTDYLTNVEKEIAAETAARNRDVSAVRAQMARNFAFNAQARKKLKTALLAKMAANAKKAKDNLDHAMRWVQAKFAAAAAIQNTRHTLEDAQAKKEQDIIRANKHEAAKNLASEVLSQQRAMAALESVTNAHISQTNKHVGENAAQIAENAKKARDDLDKTVALFDKKAADAASHAKDTRSKLSNQMKLQDKATRQYANNALKIVVASNAAQFAAHRAKMEEDRRHADSALKTQSSRLTAALDAHIALEDKNFQSAVKDIAAARKEAETRVTEAKTAFKTSLRALDANIANQVSLANTRVTQLGGVVESTKIAQAKINANVNAETKRMVKLGKDRYEEHLAKDKELESLIKANKAATDSRMEQMASHYRMELDAVKATMKKDRAHASRELARATSALYGAIASEEAKQMETNNGLRTQNREATLAISRSLREAKDDFSTRMTKLTKNVVDNQKKFEGKLDKLTGIVRANAETNEKGRGEIKVLQKANNDMLNLALREAITKGEKRMNGVESALIKTNKESKAALNNKITTEISKLKKQATDQIEGLRLNSKEARAAMKKELLFAVRSMAKEAKSNLDSHVKETENELIRINAKEAEASKTNAAGRAALGEEITAQKAIAKQQLADSVATLHRSLFALKSETHKKIKKTNNKVDAYAAAIAKEAKEVKELMATQLTDLTGKIEAQKKQASADISAADLASTKGFAAAMTTVEETLAAAEKASSDKFSKVYEDLAANRAALDRGLASATTDMNDSIAKEAALMDDRFKKTVANIKSAQDQAASQVKSARKDFATELAGVTASIKNMETKTVGMIQVVAGSVITNKAAQVTVNRRVAGEMKRIETLMNHRQSESEKARGQLRMVLDENKRAAAEETKALDNLFKRKIGSIRSEMAQNDKNARDDMEKSTQKLYSTMSEIQRQNIQANEGSDKAITKYSVESLAAIKASKKDFSDRLQTLTNVVAANHDKVEKGFEVLTGVIRSNKQEGKEDRALIRKQNKAMGDDMQKSITAAIQKGEARAKQVENEARSHLAGMKKAMLVEITNTVEEYADIAFKTISGNHQKIADNYLSLKSYAVTAGKALQEYTANGKGKNLSALGDLLNSVAALSAVKPKPAEGLSPNGELPSPFGSTKIKVDNKVTKINGMVNEYTKVANLCRQRWPMGLGKYLLDKLDSSMSSKGVLQVDKLDKDSRQGNFVFMNGHQVGLSNRLNDFSNLAVKMGDYEATLAAITAELSGKTAKLLKKRAYAAPPEWAGN